MLNRGTNDNILLNILIYLSVLNDVMYEHKRKRTFKKTNVCVKKK